MSSYYVFSENEWVVKVDSVDSKYRVYALLRNVMQYATLWDEVMSSTIKTTY